MTNAKVRVTAVAMAACAVFAGCAIDNDLTSEHVSTTSAALDAVTAFGTNPGNLLMFRYVPAAMPQNAPVVVVLHGCTQTAANFANAGWNALADQYKFYVVYAAQQAANNPSTCFDWFGKYNTPADKTNLTRGQGENLSIKQMVDKTKQDFSVDASRVFVAGFSAGAAFASIMLAAWPDVFAAGGIGEGVPYDCPSTQNIDVFQCMNPGKTLAAADWGSRAKAAYPGYAGPWPRVSIWEGTQDTTVATSNATQLIAQWTSVHGLAATPSAHDTVDGQAHAVFNDGNGRAMVESYSVSGMAHGFAVDATHGCGTVGQYTPDAHICEALHMIRFFGIGSPSANVDGGAVSSDGGASHGDASSGGWGDGGCAPSCGGGGASSGDASADGSMGQGDAADACWGSAHASGCAMGAPRTRWNALASLVGALALLALARASRARRARS
jgi:poly(hydroxyalkanoate) depolymerase family esterase